MTLFNHYQADRKYWESQIRDFLELVVKYHKSGKKTGPLIRSARDIIVNSDNIIGVVVLYEMLLTKYPEFLANIQSLDDEESPEDEGGPLAISQDETKPKTFSMLMKSHEHTHGRSYQ